jgi:hypothetical protein
VEEILRLLCWQDDTKFATETKYFQDCRTLPKPNNEGGAHVEFVKRRGAISFISTHYNFGGMRSNFWPKVGQCRKNMRNLPLAENT